MDEYRLSGQYTPQNLLEAYRESILFELEQKSMVEKRMFQKAKCSFENENVLTMTLADTIVAEGRTESIVSYLKNTFENRFHVPLEVHVCYEKPEESKLKKFSELQIQEEVNSILEQRQALQEARPAQDAGEKKTEPKRAARPKEKAAPQSFAGKKVTFSARPSLLDVPMTPM